MGRAWRRAGMKVVDDSSEDLSQDEPELSEDEEEDFDEFAEFEDYSGPSQRTRGPAPVVGELVDGPSRKKKVLSVEEQRIKRAELARRRKNLSEKRLEEEKQDTLDKLLKKRATKAKRDDLDEQDKRTRLVEHPAFVRFLSRKDADVVGWP